MNIDDIWCTEEFINVAMNNTEHLTTEQVENKPIKDENGVTIGRLTDADEDLIYGIVFSVSSIYKDATPASCSIEIVSEKGEDEWKMKKDSKSKSESKNKHTFSLKRRSSWTVTAEKKKNKVIQ